MASAKPAPINRVPIGKSQPTPVRPATQSVIKPVSKPAVVTKTETPAKPKVEPAVKPDVSKAKVTKPEVKPPVSTSKPKSSKKTLGDVYRSCVEHNKYYKLPDFTQNPLSLSGAMNHLKKEKNVDLLYHGLLRCVGTDQAIQEFVDNPENIDALINAGMTDDVSELNNSKWVVNREVLEEYRNVPDSWIYKELMANKQVNMKPVKRVDDHCGEVSAYLEAIKASRSKTAIKKDPVTGLRLKVEEAGKINKVLDVSKFVKEKLSGYKACDAPKEGGRSRRSRIVSYPICSDNPDTLADFLSAMGLSEEQVASVVAEWSPNNA